MKGLRQMTPPIALALGIAAGAAFLIGLYLGFHSNGDHRAKASDAFGKTAVTIEKNHLPHYTV
jgi:hypothetical protein